MSYKNNWICPICRRNFARKNQFHVCDTYPLKDHHLSRAGPGILEIYNIFMEFLESLGPFLIESLKSYIAVKKRTIFLVIWIQRKAIKIQFALHSEVKSARFYNHFQRKDLFYYEIYLRSLEEFDTKFKEWINIAYTEN